MQFSLKEFIQYYELDSVLYSIEIYVTPLSEIDYLSIVEKIKYYCRKDNISFLAVYSTTDSDTAKLIKINSGKRGRPYKRVIGKKVDGHTHTVIIGSKNKSASKTAKCIKKSIDKRYKKHVCRIVSKGNNIHAYNTLNYCYKQADIIRSGGNFNFKEYCDTHRKYDNLS